MLREIFSNISVVDMIKYLTNLTTLVYIFLP